MSLLQAQIFNIINVAVRRVCEELKDSKCDFQEKQFEGLVCDLHQNYGRLIKSTRSTPATFSHALTKLWNGISLRALNGLFSGVDPMHCRVEDFTEYSVSSVMFELAIKALFETKSSDEAESVLLDSRIQELGAWYNAEKEFIRNFDPSRTELEDDTIIMRLLRSHLNNNEKIPNTKVGVQELYREYDIYDEYIRKREARLEALVATPTYAELTPSLVDNMVFHGVDLYEANQFRGVSFRRTPAMVVNPGPGYGKCVEVMEDWILDIFDVAYARLYVAEAVYHAGAYMHAYVTNPHYFEQTGINYLALTMLDDAFEEFPPLAIKCIKRIRTGIPFDYDDWDWNWHILYKKHAYYFFAAGYLVEKLSKGFMNAFDIFITNIHKHQSGTSNITDPISFVESRLLDFGGAMFVFVTTAMLNLSIKPLDPESRDIVRMSAIGNDLYSCGKEWKEHYITYQNSTVFYHMYYYPNITRQKAVYMTEALRDKWHLVGRQYYLDDTKYKWIYFSASGCDTWTNVVTDRYTWTDAEHLPTLTATITAPVSITSKKTMMCFY